MGKHGTDALADIALLDELTVGDAYENDPVQGRILDAAHELFLAFGLRRTTIEQIARQAGIGRPTLYRRFRDKDAIVQAVFLREARRLVDEVRDRVAHITPAEDMLLEAFVVATDTVRRDPLLRRLLDTEPEAVLPFLTIKAMPLMDMGHALVGGPLKRLQKQGALKGLKLDYIREALGRLFISLVVTPATLLPADNTPRLKKLAQTVVRPMLAAH